MVPRRLLFVPLAAVLSVACGPAAAPPPAEPTGPVTVANAGFLTPESVLHDATADVYLVSNINGAPLDVDGNGFISRVSPTGEVLALRWIDGAAEGVTLNAPKGMAIVGDVLYVADITVVRRFDRTTGAPLGDTEITGATFLNDLAPASDGGIYVTDTGMRAGEGGFLPSGADAVYHIAADGAVHEVAEGDHLGRPNGVREVAGEVWVVTFGSGELYRVTNGGKADSLTLPTGSLDGLEVADGTLLISSWEGAAVYRGSPAGPFTVVVDSVDAPADIGYDAARRRLLIPLFNLNELRFIPLGQ